MENFRENFRETENFRENFRKNENFRENENFRKLFREKRKKFSRNFRENTKTNIFVSTLLSDPLSRSCAALLSLTYFHLAGMNPSLGTAEDFSLIFTHFSS
jgi:hypothetical protein